ncbi:MAG: phenylacetate--CoA ligase family protein [Phycisphaerales bacterium]|nr:phenylacetate--CoA ligase family protein [Phycisphaerales bacterium]
MNARLVRHVVYPLHERWFGRETFRLLRQLDESQWWPRERIRELQAGKLRRLFLHAAESNTYFAQAFGDSGIDPRVDEPFAVLSALPTLTRDKILANTGAFMSAAPGNRVRRMSTGGSTGEPLTFLVSRTREAFDKAARMRAHRWFGVHPGDREMYVWGAPIEYRRQDRWRTLRDRLLNDALISAFDLAPGRGDDYSRRLERFNPVCLFGYPSSMATLCDLIDDAGLRPRLPVLRAVFTTGELLDAGQRERLRSFFGVPVADGYGGRDSGSCAHECPAGRMHITAEHVILEIIDDAGRPLPTGETGEIAVTNLDNLATPFIRYRTGDVGRLSDEPCPCGRTLDVMDVVQGRRTDHLVTVDGRLRHALALIYLLRDAPGVRKFQVHQRHDRSVEVRVVAGASFDDVARRRLTIGVQGCVGDGVPISIRDVPQIDAQQSGKFRCVVSDAVGGWDCPVDGRNGRDSWSSDDTMAKSSNRVGAAEFAVQTP